MSHFYNRQQVKEIPTNYYIIFYLLFAKMKKRILFSHKIFKKYNLLLFLQDLPSSKVLDH